MLDVATPTLPRPLLWDAETLDRLCALLSMGTPLRRIALELGLSQADIVEKARQLGRVPQYYR